MAVTYEIRGDLLRLDLAGEYTVEELRATFRAGLADPACPGRVRLLVDVTRSESLPRRSVEDIRTVSEALGPHAERIGGRCAVVAAGDVHFGLSRMGAVYTEGVGVEARVFREAEPALEWLHGTAGS